MIINFEYRPDPEKSGKENTWRDKCNAEAVGTILAQLETMAAVVDEQSQQISEYLRLLKIPAPTDC